MIYDCNAHLTDDLATQDKPNSQYNEEKGASCLVSGFVDECLAWSCREEWNIIGVRT